MTSSLNYYIERLTKDLETQHITMSTGKLTLKQKLHSEIENYFNDKDYKLLIALDNITAKNQPLHYICCCGAEKHKAFKEILTRNCRECKNKALTETPNNINVCPRDIPDEIWKETEGGFISNKGRACNAFGKLLTMDERGRYFLSGKLQYSTILMAKAFNIQNIEKLKGQKSDYIVRNITNNQVPTLDDIYIGDRKEVGKINGQKARKSEEFKEKMELNIVKHMEKYEYKVVPEFPNHLIFEDGNIYNNADTYGSQRFLNGSNVYQKDSKTYKRLHFNHMSILLHRLVCYAFNPIEGKTKLEDYEKLQVNHIDGNTLNNCKDNVEWVTKSQNIQHAYDTGLNKKIRAIIQYDMQNNVIAEFESIAKASRETKYAEHQIREVAKGRMKPTECIWKYKDESKNEEFSKKYASKVKPQKRKIEVEEEVELVFEE